MTGYSDNARLGKRGRIGTHGGETFAPPSLSTITPEKRPLGGARVLRFFGPLGERLTRLAYVGMFLSGLSLPWMAVAEQTSGYIPSMEGMITNCPTITDLTMRYTHGSDPPKLYRFMYQSNAFCFRMSETNAFGPDNQDAQGGYWDGEFWYYTLNMLKLSVPAKLKYLVHPIPFLFVVNTNETDATHQISYYKVEESLKLFGFITTCGISRDGGPNTVVAEGEGNFTYVSKTNTTDQVRIVAHFDHSGGTTRPSGLTLQHINAVHGEQSQRAEFTYSTDIADGRFPAVIRVPGELFEIQRISFGPPSADSSLFRPGEALLMAPSVQHIIHTNGADYRLMNGNGQLVKVPTSDEAWRRLHNPPVATLVPSTKARQIGSSVVVAASMLILFALTRRSFFQQKLDHQTDSKENAS